jgi:hypothetical protein
MVNRIDKWRTISQWILEIIYTVNTTEQLTFTVGNSPYSGITTTHMTNKNYEIDPH